MITEDIDGNGEWSKVELHNVRGTDILHFFHSLQFS